MLLKYLPVVFSVVLFFCNASAQTRKHDLDVVLYDLDLYPFEVIKYDNKWGFSLKPSYEKQNAQNYFSKNFHYNTRKDTLLRNAWLVPPVYDKFEKWSYGLSLNLIAGIRRGKVDVFTHSGELLARNVTELKMEKSGMERSDMIMIMKTGDKWQWFYEGDFYKSGNKFYYHSDEFDVIELVLDSVSLSYTLKAGEKGKQAEFNEIGNILFADAGYEYKKLVMPVAEVVDDSTMLAQQPIYATTKSVVSETTTAKNLPAKKSTEQQPVKVVAKKETAEELSAREEKRMLQKKIEERDKMITYVFFTEKNLFGLKSAEGKVLIYPVMKNITITYPSNRELEIPYINSSIRLEMNGTIFDITSSIFGGPETLECIQSGTAIKYIMHWNKNEEMYVFE